MTAKKTKPGLLKKVPVKPGIIRKEIKKGGNFKK